MSANLRRKPVPASGEVENRLAAAHETQPATLGPQDSDGPRAQLNHNTHGTEVMVPARGNGSLGPDKAKLEQLAYLLLDLLSTDSQGKLPKTTAQPIGSHTGRDALPSPPPSQETEQKHPPFISQVILKPMAIWPEQTSQTLLAHKPWLRERVVVDMAEVDNEPSAPNVGAERDPSLEPGIESTPHMTGTLFRLRIRDENLLTTSSAVGAHRSANHQLTRG